MIQPEEIPTQPAPARGGDLLVECPRPDCDWHTYRPDQDNYAWSAGEAHRIRHERDDHAAYLEELRR